jgi:2-polyprenyl-3-methyl-5-hydroxy-6-metoxy-1,4-benzoquinol methylase
MRNKKILVVAANPQDGTSFYRAVGPLSKLEGVDLVYSKEVNWAVLSSIDILFMQRPAAQVNVQMIDDAKRFNIPVWCDWDDDGFHLEPHNPAYEYFQSDEKLAALRECLRLADICTVTQAHLRDVFLKEVPDANIVIVPNAVDDTLFSLEPSYHQRNKIIAMRGGSSHEKDWELHKDVILESARKHPDWTWAIMGYHPEWMNQIENIRIYQFEDIPRYFQKLMELRPAIGLVTLTDTLFNRSKTNIAFQELTLAGATVIASNLPEFFTYGCMQFGNAAHLDRTIDCLIEGEELRMELYQMAITGLLRLSDVNNIRIGVINELTKNKKVYHPAKIELPTFTDKQFHDYELSHGMTPDLEQYQQLNEKTARWIIETMNPKNALELGCGVGGTLHELLKRGVNAFGFELNPHSVKYFQDHYPIYRHQIIQADITTEPVLVDDEKGGDLVYSIECFEHITMPEDWWIKYLNDLSLKFRHFYFTSTPFYTVESFDRAWGHNNIRLMSRWKKLFEMSGWELINSPKITVPWDLYFKSKNIK